MKRIVSTLLVALSLFTCVTLMGCDSSSNSREEDGNGYEEKFQEKEDNIVYEEDFLGKWSNDEALLSFQYKDDVYCGGALSSEMAIVEFTKYTATKTTLTIHMENGKTETFNYKFDDDCLYLDDTKFEKFN